MLVPSTPTSASGAFWKGSELGGDPPAQPTAPSTTSEVVKSKSSQPSRLGVGGSGGGADTCSTVEAQQRHPCPRAFALERGGPSTQLWTQQRAGLVAEREGRALEARQVGLGWEAIPDSLPTVAEQSWSAGGGPSGLTTRCTARRRSPPSPPSRCPTSSTPATGSRPTWWPSSCDR